jgi:thioredoxin reductase (NADPH)
MENIIIIGGGPAGNTAAIYAARANLHPLMLEGFYAGGVAAGGQLTTTTEVENYPGYTAIQGPELMLKMREQAIHCGTRIETKTVDSVDLGAMPYTVVIGGQTLETRAVIISTGATAKRMWVPGESEYRQRGVSACAVCDGALPIYRGKVLVVVGGGDTACEEALYLTKFASKVIMLVRRDVLRASKAMQTRAQSNEKIEIMWNTTLVSIDGSGAGSQMSGVTVHSAKTSVDTAIEAAGLFYAIGHTPNTSFLNGQVQLDAAGYIMTQPGSTRVYGTDGEIIPGVFASGDVQDHIYRQAVTSAGSGCMAALDAERWLAEAGME